MTRSWMSEASVGHSPSSTRPTSTWQQSRPASTRQSTYDSTTTATASNKPSRQSSSGALHTAHMSMTGAGTEPPSPTVPERGRTLTRPPRPRAPLLETISGSPASGSPVAAMHAYHQSTTAAAAVAAYEEQSRATHSRHTSSSSRSRPPRRTSSMLFLSVGFFMTFAKLSNIGRGASLDQGGSAWATSDEVVAVAGSNWPSHSPRGQPVTSPLLHERSYELFVESIDRDEEPGKPPPGHGHEGDHEDRPYPDYERFIGRASAWLCTTLYLTSRLPQIWTNVSVCSYAHRNRLLVLNLRCALDSFDGDQWKA